MQTAEGKLYMFVAIDRTSKFAFVQLHLRATKMIAAAFVSAYNFARRLKTLKGLTPYEFICRRWTVEPKRFKLNPLQQMPGLNI